MTEREGRRCGRRRVNTARVGCSRPGPGRKQACLQVRGRRQARSVGARPPLAHAPKRYHTSANSCCTSSHHADQLALADGISSTITSSHHLASPFLRSTASPPLRESWVGNPQMPPPFRRAASRLRESWSLMRASTTKQRSHTAGMANSRAALSRPANAGPPMLCLCHHPTTSPCSPTRARVAGTRRFMQPTYCAAPATDAEQIVGSLHPPARIGQLLHPHCMSVHPTQPNNKRAQPTADDRCPWAQR